MKERKTVMEAVDKAKKAGRRAVLASVVRVRGSAYRREGASMAIDENGILTGMISGGCLEADVAETAKEVLETGVPILKTYAMDEELVWGLGLGCPGTVDVYMELVSEPENLTLPWPDPFEEWVDCVLNDRAGVLATVLHGGENTPPSRMFLQKEGRTQTGSFNDRELDSLAAMAAWGKLQDSNPKSETMQMTTSDGKRVDVFIDVYQPAPKLVIFGAGHDAIPVARYGVSLGMKTMVVDQRPAFNSEERFPGTERVIVSPDHFTDKVSIDGDTYVVIMNHHLEKDRATLKFVLQTNAYYIGVLGPRSRCDRIMDGLSREGFVFDSDRINRMYNPIGLDIGAATPEEIAISIHAEIIALKTGHRGGFLKGSEHIHKVPQ